MDVFEMEMRINEVVEEMLRDLPYVNAAAANLDSRCGKIKVGEEFIAVSKDSDNRLQYYGGFEYISKEFHKEFGDWVFYMVDEEDEYGGCRVIEAISYFQETLEGMEA